MSFLEFDSLHKSFSGVHALKGVSFEIQEKQIHGLIGENGAGKSTLIKILSGVHRPDKGTIKINGDVKKFASPLEALRAGISVIYQELQLVPNQTVAENITLGTYVSKYGCILWQDMYKSTQDFLDSLEIEISSRKKISDLTIGQRQMIEIAKAIHHNAQIIALDEPTSSLSKKETNTLFTIIKKLKQRGKAMIYISHRMSEIFEICDACTVLKDGFHVVTHESNDSALNRETLIQEMTGQNLGNIYSFQKREPGNVVMEAKSILGKGLSSPANIHVKEKEIVGLFGLVGAGRSELAKLIYGAVPRKEGQIILEEKNISQKKPKHSIEKGIMFCTEDRKQEGIIQGRGVWENINVSSRRNFSIAKVFINKKQEMENASVQVSDLSIKTPHLFQDVANLSGGNQQKVILARWLSEQGLKVLIVDEPTRGIDVGAKKEIYSILYSLAKQGVGIIVISSELPEIMGVCDRLYVMREGVISKEFERKDFKEEDILDAAFPKEIA